MGEHVYPRRWTSQVAGCYVEQASPDVLPEFVFVERRNSFVGWTVKDAVENLCDRRTETFNHHANPAPNACAGIKDPAAIRELVVVAKGALEELKLLKVHYKQNGITINITAIKKLAAAIAKVQV